jgi:hypothetical protein
MAGTVSHFTSSPKQALALVGAVLAMCLGFLAASPASSQAGVSNYCSNVTLGDHELCYGTVRVLHQTYGWGDNHSVCVWWAPGSKSPWGRRCSAGPGYGVYSDDVGSNFNLYPGIDNNAAGNNLVHGIALTY